MCITKVESFEYGGVLYPTELAAVDAAITALVNPMGGSPAAEIKRALIADTGKFLDLLTRHKRIKDDNPVLATAALEKPE